MGNEAREGDERAAQSPWPTTGRERALVVMVLLGLSLFSPYFRELYSANEHSRLLLTNAIVVDHSVIIDQAIKRLADSPDKSRRDGHYYSDKAPGVAFLAVPVVACYRWFAAAPSLEGEMRAARFIAATVPTALLLALLLSYLAERLHDVRVRLALGIGYGFGSLATTYGILLFGHQLSSLLMFGTFLLARRADERSRWRALATGMCAASAIVTEYQNAVLLVPLGALFLWRARAKPLPVLCAMLGALPPTALLLAYHQAAFGSPWHTGYVFLANDFAAVHSQGLLGIGTPTLANLWLSLFSAEKGLLFYSPFLALGVCGLAFARPRDRDLTLSLMMTASFVLFVSSMIYAEGGWTVSLRHLTPIVPWMLLPAGLLVERGARGSVLLFPLLVGLVLASVFLTGLPTVVYPYLHDLANPVFQLIVPAFLDGWLPPSALSPHLPSRPLVVVMAMLITLALGALIVNGPSSRARRALALAVALAIALLVPLLFSRVGHSQASFADSARRQRDDLERRYHGALDPLAHPRTARPP